MNQVFPEHITNEELDLLPPLKFEGRIMVIDNFEMLYAACQQLQKYQILGFDTETKPNFKKGKTNNVCLIQLSTIDDSYIFRLNKIGLPDELQAILASNDIKKIGVAVRDDVNQIAKLKRFVPQGFVDLQSMVSTYGISEKGLKKMAGIVLGGRISKAQRTSNWENDELSQQQLIYAATDSWACLKIWERLTN